MDKIRLDRILSDLKHGDLIDTSLTELECIEIIERNKELEEIICGTACPIEKDSTFCRRRKQIDSCLLQSAPPAGKEEAVYGGVTICPICHGTRIKGKCTKCKSDKEVAK
jgi:hypothetical protein